MPDQHDESDAQDGGIDQILPDAIGPGADVPGGSGQDQGAGRAENNARAQPGAASVQTARGRRDDADEQGRFQRFAKDNDGNTEHEDSDRRVGCVIPR